MLLYPKIRERPPDFRLNPASPLYRSAVFLGLGAQGGTAHYHDSSPFGNHGTLTNMDPATDWVWDGVLKRARVDFDGSDDYVAGQSYTYSGPITILFWNWATDQTGSAWGGKESGAGLDRCQIHAPYNGSLYWDYGDIAAGGRLSASYSSYLSQWTHIAVQSAGAGGSYKAIVINGKMAAESTDASDGPSGSVLFDIGRAALEATTYYHTGYLSDVLRFHRLLWHSEISALADPSNIDLRIGNTPLILPPTRVYWPVALTTTPPVANRPRRVSYIGLLGV